MKKIADIVYEVGEGNTPYRQTSYTPKAPVRDSLRKIAPYSPQQLVWTLHGVKYVRVKIKGIDDRTSNKVIRYFVTPVNREEGMDPAWWTVCIWDDAEYKSLMEMSRDEWDYAG